MNAEFSATRGSILTMVNFAAPTPPPGGGQSSGELPDGQGRDRSAALPEVQAARLHALRGTMEAYAAWEASQTDRLIQGGCVGGPLVVLLMGAVVWVFAGAPVAVGTTVALWTSNLVVVAAAMAVLSARLERRALERFDELATVPTNDEITLSAVLSAPGALAGPERLHHIVASLLTRSGVEPAEVARAVDEYRRRAMEQEAAPAEVRGPSG